MGCMRLSTERDRDEARAIAVLHAAFDRGVNFLDTADVYCWDSSRGRSQRAAHRAGGRDVDRRPSRILVATKGGLTRPQGTGSRMAEPAISLTRARPACARSASIESRCISFTRLDPANAADDERPRARGAETRRTCRTDRALQREGRPDRRGPPHHRDRGRAGGNQRLAGRKHPQRRGRVRVAHGLRLIA